MSSDFLTAYTGLSELEDCRAYTLGDSAGVDDLFAWLQCNNIRLVDIMLGTETDSIVLDFNSVDPNFNYRYLLDAMEGGKGHFLEADFDGFSIESLGNEVYRISSRGTPDSGFFKGISFLSIFNEYASRGYTSVHPVRDSINLLIKPTCDCNLKCAYCYDLDARREFSGTRLMLEDIDKFLSLLSNFTKSCQWIWHGGEVLLMGKEWFRRVYSEIFPKYKMLSFEFSMVSNGVVWDEEWFSILYSNGVSLASSFNAGNQCSVREAGLHPNFFPDLSLKGTVEGMEQDASESIVWANFQKHLKKYGRLSGVIDVVTNECIPHLVEIESFYKKNGIRAVFNDCFESTSTREGGNSLLIEDNVFVSYFDKYAKHWMHDKEGYDTRFVSAPLHALCGCSSLCVYSDCRDSWLGLHPDGSITPCDRMSPDKYIFGYLKDTKSLSELYQNAGYTQYSADIDKRFSTYCEDCGHFKWCKGGCNSTIVDVNNGDASKVYESHCATTVAQFRIVYKYLRNLDIYSGNVNPDLKSYFFKNWVFTPLEVFGWLRGIGVQLDLEYDENKAVYENSEFILYDDICSKLSKYLRSNYDVENESLITGDFRKEMFLRALEVYRRHLLAMGGGTCVTK